MDELESLFLHSPLCGTNWASHVILMNASLPLGIYFFSFSIILKGVLVTGIGRPNTHFNFI